LDSEKEGEQQQYYGTLVVVLSMMRLATVFIERQLQETVKKVVETIERASRDRISSIERWKGVPSSCLWTR